MDKILLFVTLVYLFATASACCPDDSGDRDELTEGNQSTDTGSLDEKAPDIQLVSAQIQTSDEEWVDIENSGRYIISNDEVNIKGKIKVANNEKVQKMTLTATYQGGNQSEELPLKPTGHSGNVYNFVGKLCPPPNKKRFTVTEATLTVTTNKRVSDVAVPAPLYFTIKK